MSRTPDTVPAWLHDNPLGVSITPADVRDRLDPNLDWEARYRALIALGDLLPALPDAVRIDINRLHGCQAVVWVDHAFDVRTQRLYLSCATETRVVAGLLACLLNGYNAQTPEVASAFDAKALVADLELAGHMASERNNGLLAFIGRARMLAHRYGVARRPSPGQHHDA
ncbi:MAG: SufE family protein [Pseudomonadota bacterium]